MVFIINPLGMAEFVFDGIKIGMMSYDSKGERYKTEVELIKNKINK